MERVVNRARNFDEAEKWDIRQQVSMTPKQRREIVLKLRERVYGRNRPDVRQAHKGS